MKERQYYIQTRKKDGTIVEEWIAGLQDNDNIILDKEGYPLLVIRYKEDGQDEIH